MYRTSLATENRLVQTTTAGKPIRDAQGLSGVLVEQDPAQGADDTIMCEEGEGDGDWKPVRLAGLNFEETGRPAGSPLLAVKEGTKPRGKIRAKVDPFRLAHEAVGGGTRDE